MKKPRAKKKKKPKKTTSSKSARKKRTRVKVHKGPFQIELPLQMPLFPVTLDPAPAKPAG